MMTMTADIQANTDGTITVTERDLLGVLISYRIQAKNAQEFLVEHGLTDLEIPLSNTDGDLVELLTIRDEFLALMDDVMAEDRTDRLIELRQRFLDYREAVRIAEAEFTDNEEGGTNAE